MNYIMLIEGDFGGSKIAVQIERDVAIDAG
jgi:hypothetical protein